LEDNYWQDRVSRYY